MIFLNENSLNFILKMSTYTDINTDKMVSHMDTQGGSREPIQNECSHMDSWFLVYHSDENISECTITIVKTKQEAIDMLVYSLWEYYQPGYKAGIPPAKLIEMRNMLENGEDVFVITYCKKGRGVLFAYREVYSRDTFLIYSESLVDRAKKINYCCGGDKYC